MLLSSLLASFAHGEVIQLTSSDGGVLRGTVKPGTKPNTIHLIREDGQLYKNVPISKFSVESKKKIAAALAVYKEQRANADITQESRLKVSFQRQKASNNNDYGDIDDRIITIRPQVTIENETRDKTFQKVQGEVIVIGREAVAKDRWVILDRQKFTFGKIEIDEKVTWEGREFECRYDPDYAGFDYEGYLIILKDNAGKVGKVKGSNSRWESLVSELLKARKRTGYDKNFSRKLPLRSTFGLPVD